MLCKNRYVGRTFIQPTSHLRQLGVAIKFGVLYENVVGKRIVLIDDSIVRGNTMGPIVKLLKSSGASEVTIFDVNGFFRCLALLHMLTGQCSPLLCRIRFKNHFYDKDEEEDPVYLNSDTSTGRIPPNQRSSNCGPVGPLGVHKRS